MENRFYQGISPWGFFLRTWWVNILYRPDQVLTKVCFIFLINVINLNSANSQHIEMIRCVVMQHWPRSLIICLALYNSEGTLLSACIYQRQCFSLPHRSLVTQQTNCNKSQRSLSFTQEIIGAWANCNHQLRFQSLSQTPMHSTTLDSKTVLSLVNSLCQWPQDMFLILVFKRGGGGGFPSQPLWRRRWKFRRRRSESVSYSHHAHLHTLAHSLMTRTQEDMGPRGWLLFLKNAMVNIHMALN